MHRTLTLIPALVALVLACPVAAQSAEAPANASATRKISRAETTLSTRIAVAVNGHVLEDLKPVITDQAKLGPLFMRMVLVAKQEAVGANCAAYSVDRKQQVATMLGSIAPALEGLEQDKAQSTINQVLRHYHTMLGGALAQHAADPDGFCAAGKDLYERLSADADGDKVLILTPAA
jgi:hypothetical protein